MSIPPPSSLTPSPRESKSSFIYKSYADGFFSIAIELLNKVKKSNALPNDISSFKRRLRELHETCEKIDTNVASKIADVEIPKLAQSANDLWGKTKIELKSITQMPLRVEFISAQNTELIRIGKKALTIIELKEKSTILSAELFRAISNIVNGFLTMFLSILTPGRIDTTQIKSVIDNISQLIKDLPIKFTAFCFEEKTSTKTEFYTYLTRYLKKINSRTQQLLEVGSDPAEVYPYIHSLDKFFSQLMSDFKVETFFKVDPEELIKTSLRYMDKELYPALGSKKFSTDVQSMISGSTVVKVPNDGSTIPWYVDPIFIELKRLNSELEELADMRLTRHDALVSSKDQLNAEEVASPKKNEMNVHRQYGIKNVIEETISALKLQIEETKTRTDDFKSKSLNPLSEFQTKSNNQIIPSVLDYSIKEGQKLESSRQSMVEALEVRHNAVLDEIDRYLGLIDTESNSVNGFRQKVKQLQREIDHARQVLDSAIGDNDPLKSKIEDLSNEKDALSQRALDLDAENSAIEAEISQLKKEIAKTQVDDANFTADCKEIADGLRKTIKELSDPLESLKKELEQIQQKYKESKELLPKLEDRREFLAEEVYGYRIRLTRVKARWDSSRLLALSEKLSHL